MADLSPLRREPLRLSMRCRPNPMNLIVCRWEERDGRKVAIWCEAINMRADVLKALEEIAADIKPMTALNYWPAEIRGRAQQEEKRLNLLRGVYRGVAHAPQDYLIARVLEYGVGAVGGLEANKLNRLKDRAALLWPEPKERTS